MRIPRKDIMYYNSLHSIVININIILFSDVESMPTFHGKKLLVASLWGMLRHPNYAGDILVHIVFALPGIISGHYVGAAPAVLTIGTLIHRAWRDHARCQRRYGSAWQRYCKRVPSILLPKLL